MARADSLFIDVSVCNYRRKPIQLETWALSPGRGSSFVVRFITDTLRTPRTESRRFHSLSRKQNKDWNYICVFGVFTINVLRTSVFLERHQNNHLVIDERKRLLSCAFDILLLDFPGKNERVDSGPNYSRIFDEISFYSEKKKILRLFAITTFDFRKLKNPNTLKLCGWKRGVWRCLRILELSPSSKQVVLRSWEIYGQVISHEPYVQRMS